MKPHVISVPEIQGTYESIIASGPSKAKHHKRLRSVTTIYSTGGSKLQFVVSIGEDAQVAYNGITEAIEKYNNL